MRETLHKTSPSKVRSELELAMRWFANVRESQPPLPFYCDPKRVGAFAVAPQALAAGDEPSLFRLFVTLSMYQALRDVVIMDQQRRMLPSSVRIVADMHAIQETTCSHPCKALASIDEFTVNCNVTKRGESVECERHPRLKCLVKDGTRIFNRMGDMGKLPASAWLRIWRGGGIGRVLAQACRQEASPKLRGTLLVEQLSRVHRVGRKLATLYVSALATPVLAPGLTPWFPFVDGNELVVIDTNVARAIDHLRPNGASRTYDAREQWLRDKASGLDLRRFHGGFPKRSPRVLQEALYRFGSKSNRVAAGDPCAELDGPCANCAKSLCPFAPKHYFPRR